ncbi:MAG: hypothetical protein IPL39_05940 [Opitutaceae bacterium]|nr:hypothetical protein [Opitutaceae bacterium]
MLAAAVPLGWRIRVRLREVLARGKAVLDVALGRGPKFLGPLELVSLAEREPQADEAPGAR